MKLFLVLISILLASCVTQRNTTIAPQREPCTNVAQCALSLQSSFSQHWTRPADFEGDWRELTVKLRVELDDLFNLKDIAVIQSSGFPEFDRSAMASVLKAEPFVELRGLSYKDYAHRFKKFTITFVPEDLYDAESRE